MNIQTADGISIHVLPDCARCRNTWENPMFMGECPIFNFDDYGLCCVPELCDDYTEDWGEEE